MKIGMPAETRFGESRVTVRPETVKNLTVAKHQVMIETGAGKQACTPDATGFF